MGQVLVHNITDRPNSESFTCALTIANEEIRPGKFISVDSSLLSKKHKELHGTSIWIGNELPPKFKATSKAALRNLTEETTKELTASEVRQFLSTCSREELTDYCASMVPPLNFTKAPSDRMLVVKISRAICSTNYILDPEKFFWVRRWTKEGDTFIER